MNTKQLLEKYNKHNFRFSLNGNGVYEIYKNDGFYCFAHSKEGLRKFIDQFDEAHKLLNEGFSMNLDKEFIDAIHAINVLRDRLRGLKQNQSSENKALVDVCCNNIINGITGLKEFDR